jgi:cohesin loading factor subunit SCC2
MAVGIVKDQMAKIIIPVVESLADESELVHVFTETTLITEISSRFLDHIVSQELTASKKRLQATFMSPALARIAQTASSTLPRITSLLARSDISFSDHLVIQTVYMSMTPLFFSEPVAKKKGKDTLGGGGRGVMKALRVEALGCLRGVSCVSVSDDRAHVRFLRDTKISDSGLSKKFCPRWAKPLKQTMLWQSFSVLSWVTFLKASLTIRLANGPSIHTISALLLQLIQASAFGITRRVRKIRSNLAFLSLQGDSETHSLQKPVDDGSSLEEVGH